MKKILIAVNLILVTLIVSGCGCSKKEKVLDYVVLKNGLEVSLEQTVENDSTDDIFKYENFYNSMLENNFKCKNK